MADIIKTWPAVVSARTTLAMFSERLPPWTMYYFTLGRGLPKRVNLRPESRSECDRLWFTYRGRIMGSFDIVQVLRNDGSLPRLNRLDGGESDWQIKPDAWVAICKPPCQRLRERVYMSGFRGFRYFNLEQYRTTTESRIRL